uniref:Uncharacterized protein n=1 Tax=Arundo donax TaxID=35708 RepID=A0A0A8XY49_ARUDO
MMAFLFISRGASHTAHCSRRAISFRRRILCLFGSHKTLLILDVIRSQKKLVANT